MELTPIIIHQILRPINSFLAMDNALSRNGGIATVPVAPAAELSRRAAQGGRECVEPPRPSFAHKPFSLKSPGAKQKAEPPQ